MLGGTHVGPIKFPEKKNQPDGYWKKLLTGAVEDLVEQQAAAGKRVVFLFDEMPWMLSAIADPKRDGEQTAMEVLDVLRGLRQSATTGQGFRMVLCGQSACITSSEAAAAGLQEPAGQRHGARRGPAPRSDPSRPNLRPSCSPARG